MGFGGEPDDDIAGVQDRLGRAVVLLQCHHGGRRREARWEIQDVAHRRCSEGVDRLRIVSDHGKPAPVRLHGEEDVRLKRVGILIFVDQDVIEHRP
jgi:hypothetical protein